MCGFISCKHLRLLLVHHYVRLLTKNIQVVPELGRNQCNMSLVVDLCLFNIPILIHMLPCGTHMVICIMACMGDMVV